MHRQTDRKTDRHESENRGHPFRVSLIFPSTYHQGSVQYKDVWIMQNYCQTRFISFLSVYVERRNDQRSGMDDKDCLLGACAAALCCCCLFGDWRRRIPLTWCVRCVGRLEYHSRFNTSTCIYIYYSRKVYKTLVNAAKSSRTYVLKCLIVSWKSEKGHFLKLDGNIQTRKIQEIKIHICLHGVSTKVSKCPVQGVQKESE